MDRIDPLTDDIHELRKAAQEAAAASKSIEEAALGICDSVKDLLCEIDNLRATIGASPYDLPADVVVLAISRLKAGCKAG